MYIVHCKVSTFNFVIRLYLKEQRPSNTIFFYETVMRQSDRNKKHINIATVFYKSFERNFIARKKGRAQQLFF